VGAREAARRRASTGDGIDRGVLKVGRVDSFFVALLQRCSRMCGIVTITRAFSEVVLFNSNAIQ
jgi:hypothetical protein